MTYFKFLSADGKSCNGGNSTWKLPTQDDQGNWTPGEWMKPIKGDLIACENGYHLCREKDLSAWINASCYVAEIASEILEVEDKVVAREVRLLRKLNWDESTCRMFACDCAEHVLPLFEKYYPGDMRPRRAIDAARDYIHGKITKEELAAAKDAAWAAARAAAKVVAWAAARAAAWAATWAAAKDAAWTAAWDAAWAAAKAASWDAAWAAAKAAAWDAEIDWQNKRLLQYLYGEVIDSCQEEKQ